MQKFFNTILLITFLVLVALFAYKTFRTPESLQAPVREDAEQQKNITPESGIKNNTLPQLENVNTAISNTKVEDNLDSTQQQTEENTNQDVIIEENKNDEILSSKIHDYIIQHPEVLIESIEGMQKRKIEESEKKVAEYLIENKASIEQEGQPPVFGNKDGDITVVIFYDYNCTYCKQANDINNTIIEKDPGVKIVLRPIPILGGTSMYAAKVALAIHKIAEDKFSIIHEGMMKMKPLTENAVKNLLTANKIDYALVENELNSFAVKQLINQNFEFAKNVGIKGAPSYVINGISMPGLVDVEKFNTIIGELRKIAEQTKTQEEKIDYPVETNTKDEELKEIIIPNTEE